MIHACRGLAPWVLLVALGCRTNSTSTPPADANVNASKVGYPGELQPAATMGPDIQWEQRVTAQWGQGSRRGFDAVLSKVGDELLLVGLSPMKTPGFVLRWAGGTLELDNRSPETLPFEPRYIMLDVQRVFFPWIPGPPPHDGEREHHVRGEHVTERWADGRLQERRFVRDDARPPGVITVRYEGWQDGQDAPARAVLENGWFGYSLTIETIVQQRL